MLDTDLIRQQAEHSTVDVQGLANYIISTMGKMCAPIRDNDIKELKVTGNIVEVLRSVLALECSQSTFVMMIGLTKKSLTKQRTK